MQSWSVERVGAVVVAGGEVPPAEGERFAAALLAAGRGARVVELGELDLADGPTVARVVTVVRSLAEPAGIVLREAPQMLAHTLYKVGGLAAGRVVLEDPRGDERGTVG